MGLTGPGRGTTAHAGTITIPDGLPCHRFVTPFLHNGTMRSAAARCGQEPASWEALRPAGGEAILPAGVRLADAARAGRHCFIVLEGRATVEAASRRLRRELGAGAFVGTVDQRGGPLPPSGLTVELATRCRVLVIDARRLADLVSSDPAAAAAWRRLSRPGPHDPGRDVSR
jgi:hypothetical protein